MKYKEYDNLNLPAVDKAILKYWKKNKIFEKSIEEREGNEPFVFYEGPPSANGMPGIHHVMSRTIKDLFCRFKTMQGHQVKRKGGWDTHGLPVELGVEKSLGITKEDIGEKISVEEYNNTCRKEVMKYKESWEQLTQEMGFWIDLDNPYITFENDYIETVWQLLKRLYDKELLYKGYSIQPYSPAAGTGLSSHELNLPGCYRNIKDTTVTAQFKVVQNAQSDWLFEERAEKAPVYLLSWTTTPWTLPSNAALAVGKNIEYVRVLTKNKYTDEKAYVVFAKNLMDEIIEEDQALDKPKIFKGQELENIHYEPLFHFEVLKPFIESKNETEDDTVYRVITGDFVTTEEGTGIVHIAPTFGEDDQRVAQQKNIDPIAIRDEVQNKLVPLVNKQAKFVDGVRDEEEDFSGRYVRKEFHEEDDVEDVNISLSVKLKKAGKAFQIAKYEHNYPHCWRTDKPLLYYPLDSWFIKTTALKDRMIERNQEINWKPEFTGEGRFGHWLENLVDWNLSRSRYWGTPLPIWRTEDGQHEKCIGTVDELRKEVQKAVEKGYMEKPLAEDFDLHRPQVDEVVLVAENGDKMYREDALIDVWFDSGAMPYAQWHYPFENKKTFKESFPADFIAEGVDQTRGWFFTLHAIAVMLFDSVAYKNVVANGLVLDKNGNKMSKRLGNVIDPFEAIHNYGADANRWYMMVNAQPWDNIKFDLEGIREIQRKFFGTLFNTYSFFAMYANIDKFKFEEDEVPIEKRTELDRWIISLLNSLVKEVTAYYEDYDPTKAGRAIQSFVIEHLSNWYVRLSRRKFWKGDYDESKIAAYQTLYRCLEVVAQLMAPISPFYADRLFQDLNQVTNRQEAISVHLSDFPKADEVVVDSALENRMQLAQTISSLALSLRKKEQVKVRQPLNKIIIPVKDKTMKKQVESVKSLILSEVNVKAIEYVADTSGILKKDIKPNFKTLGPKLGPKVKAVARALNEFEQKDIKKLEEKGKYKLKMDDETIELTPDDVEITSEDIPGWLSASKDDVTVALDITLTDTLKDEGMARELVNRIQKIRKEEGLEVTDRIILEIEKKEWITSAINRFYDYICTETLAKNLKLKNKIKEGVVTDVYDKDIKISVTRISETKKSKTNI